MISLRHLLLITILTISVAGLSERVAYAQAPQWKPLPVETSQQKGPGDQRCCVCYHDTTDPRFLLECDTWFGLPEQSRCSSKILWPYQSDDPECWENAGCDLLRGSMECQNQSMAVYVAGHGLPQHCQPFLSQMVRLCIESGASCADVVHAGCLVFQDWLSAVKELERYQASCPNISLTITGNQCVVMRNDNDHLCRDSTTTTPCTITVSAECGVTCQFGDCHPNGSPCGTPEQGYELRCSRSTCRDSASGDITSQVCCQDSRGRLVWRPESECGECRGACCTGVDTCVDYTSSKDFLPRTSCIERGWSWFPDSQCKDLAPTACQSTLGACCITLPSPDGDEMRCLDGVTEKACRDAALRLEGDSFHWSRGKHCKDSPCTNTKGACCVKNRCTNQQICRDQIKFESCMQLRDECRNPKFDFEKQCSEFCPNLVCPEGWQHAEQCSTCPCPQCSTLVCTPDNPQCPTACSVQNDGVTVCCGIV